MVKLCFIVQHQRKQLSIRPSFLKNSEIKAFTNNTPMNLRILFPHIMTEYDIDNSVNEWSLIKVLKNGFGMHHGKLPKYIQQEILEQFNAGTFNVLFCTSTIVEGVNTDAQNMIILNASKGRRKSTPFDIKILRVELEGIIIVLLDVFSICPRIC